MVLHTRGSRSGGMASGGEVITVINLRKPNEMNQYFRLFMG